MLVLLALPLAAQPHSELPGELIRDNAYELGIPAETLEALLQLTRAGRIEREPLVDAMHVTRAVLDELLMEDVPEVDAVMAQIALLGDAETALRQFDIGELIEMRALLTQEQRDALAELMRNRPPPRHHRPPPPR
jgi:Spy/CpxP family protein refolding chaperone